MNDAPDTERKPRRRNRKRPRRIPNAAPGLERATVPDEPRAIAQNIAAPDDPAPYVPKGILAIENLRSESELAEDVTGLTPQQRRWWRHGGRTRRIKPEDKAKFLASLSRLPSVAAAAQSSGFTVRSWYCLRARDAAFAAEWDAAIDAGVPKLEHAAMIRAFHGTERPIFQNGKHVASELVVSDRLAEVLLRAHRPERYSEKLMVAGQVNGTVRHVHELAPATADLVRSIAGVGAPAIVDGTAEKVSEPRQITAAGLVEQMLGRGGQDGNEAGKVNGIQDVVPPDEASVGSQRKTR